MNRDKYNKVNPSASHFSGMPMFKLDTSISHLGDLRLETPASSQRVIASNPDRDQDLEWWWNLNKHVFFLVIPAYPFGTKDQWKVVSICGHHCATKSCRQAAVQQSSSSCRLIKSCCRQLYSRLINTKNMWEEQPLMTRSQTTSCPPLLKDFARTYKFLLPRRRL